MTRVRADAIHDEREVVAVLEERNVLYEAAEGRAVPVALLRAVHSQGAARFSFGGRTSHTIERTTRMAGEHREFQSRLIVTGVDVDGKSTFVSDAPTTDRLVADGYTRNHLWQATQVPTKVMAPNGPGSASIIPPPPAGYNYVITAFAPDSEWDYEGGYARILAESGAGDAVDPADAPGMHTTDTIDIVTVISGEACVLLETGETTMRQGDTIVQRGTKHAWRNRTDKPCVVSAVHISVIR